ncbi:YdiY family protein [Lentibacter sp. XHP0401]|jgi:putative salt-induced outer membrane protein|uniref:DUF481 domain-containing protein n=1 Tax=Lentibacter sp. XHP0401 TaxID=2984334 RepID=UPI0021E9018A|nr:DUF481 domain-containing protein [Lentibacter sp. XHP0401]MCV2893607.1 DUF481 domain-containing protein [Lentibacter sp. XHP0401]
MNQHLKLAGVSMFALMLASPVFAQTAITGVDDLNERIEDIEDDAREDLNRGNDANRFGSTGVAQGWSGSFALSASGSSGNTDSGELSGAGRVSYGVGDWNHLFGFAVEYGEANGAKNEEKFFAVYEGSRYFTEKTYAFGLARYEYDGYLTDAAGAPLAGSEKDAFVGAGIGYRFLNTQKNTWRVQGGPGARYVSDITGASDTELGFILSSRYYYAFNDNVSFTMDTDVLGSDANTILSNDAGLNFKMTNTLSTRISYRTDYNSSPAAGLKSTDNTVGVSLVLNF